MVGATNLKSTNVDAESTIDADAGSRRAISVDVLGRTSKNGNCSCDGRWEDPTFIWRQWATSFKGEHVNAVAGSFVISTTSNNKHHSVSGALRQGLAKGEAIMVAFRITSN